MQPDGTQKRTGRYKYICRFGARPLEEVMGEVQDKIKKWKKERTQSSKKANVGTLALAFNVHGSKGFRVRVKGAKMKYKKFLFPVAGRFMLAQSDYASGFGVLG